MEMEPAPARAETSDDRQSSLPAGMGEMAAACCPCSAPCPTGTVHARTYGAAGERGPGACFVLLLYCLFFSLRRNVLPPILLKFASGTVVAKASIW